MVKSKLVYPGGWIRTTYLSTRFIPDDPACELCRHASCGPYYFNLAREVVRCKRCFDPWDEHPGSGTDIEEDQ